MNNQSKFKTIENAVRIGGKGSMRRKHKRVSSSAALKVDRIEAKLEKLSPYPMSGIEQVTMTMADQSELVMNMPKVKGATKYNMLVASGTPTYVAPPARDEPEPRRPPTPSPSTPPPPPPPPPSPAFAINNKPAKKPKKPRNRVRLRNKRVQEMLLLDAGDDGEGSDLGSADDLLFEMPGYLLDGGGPGSDDSDKTTVPSDGSDMDQTIVADGSLYGFYTGEETQTECEETQEEEVESEENGDLDREFGDDYEVNDEDVENEDLQLTLDDVVSCLEDN